MSEVEADVEFEGPEEEPPGLDPETAARREAALQHVRVYGDPVLRTEARAVDTFDEALRAEVERMGHLMNDALGIGLAATQVGVPHRVLVYRVEPDSPVNALINPEILWTSKDAETMEEGCLSLPSVHVDVERPIHLRVRAKDEHGDDVLIEASGLEARVIQHEIDHLDGVLFIDHLTSLKRNIILRKLLKAKKAAADAAM